MENQEIEKQENQEIREIQEERKSKKGRIIRIAILIAALAAAVGSIFLIRGCSAPPKYEEVKDRFEQLVNPFMADQIRKMRIRSADYIV